MQGYTICEETASETVHNIWEVLPEEWHKEFLKVVIDRLTNDITLVSKDLGQNFKEYPITNNIYKLNLKAKFLDKCITELKTLENLPEWWEEDK